MSADTMQGIAAAAAAYAHEAYFSSRHAVLPSDEHLLILADNHPCEWRTATLKRLRQAIEQEGVVCEAEASYPVGGPSDGYTVAQVYRLNGGIDGSRVAELVCDLWTQFWTDAAKATTTA